MEVSTIVVSVEGRDVSVSLRALRNIPVLNDLYVNDRPLVIKGDYNEGQLLALIKIMAGGTVRPFADLSSHADVYLLLGLATELGVAKRFVADGFAGWSSHYKWCSLEDIKYLYLVYSFMPDLVNFPKFFAVGPENVAKMPEIAEFTRAIAPRLYMDVLTLFQRLNFQDGFDGTGKKTNDQVRVLEKARLDISNIFVVDPWEHGEYFTYEPRSGDIWSCDGISVYKRPSPGDVVIVDKNEFHARFDKFTCGLIKKSPSGDPDAVFPHDGVVFSGGSITKMMCLEYSEKLSRSSDLDIFVIGKDNKEKAAVVDALIKWFNTPNTYYATNSSVLSIYIKDVPRVFQIISEAAKTPFDVVDRFDMTHIGWYVYDGNVRATASTCVSMKSKLTQFTRVGRLYQDRVIKALYNGYDIEKDSHVVNNILDITEILKDPNGATITATVKSFQSWYYPRSDLMLDADEEHAHLLAEIESKSRAQVVSSDHTVSRAAMVIGGNFETYAAPAFNTFDLNSVVVLAHQRRKQSIAMSTKLGVVRLTSGMIKVVRVTADDGVTLVLAPSQEFIDFIRRVEDEVYPKYDNNRVNARLINENGEFTYVVNQKRIEDQARAGRSLLKDSRGEYRNIEEDIRIGDTLAITFTITIEKRRWMDDGLKIAIMPSMFVSYSLDPIDDTNDNTDNTDNLGYVRTPPSPRSPRALVYEADPFDAI